MPQIDPADIEALARGDHPHPFAILGRQGGVIRAFLPGAREAQLESEGSRRALTRLHGSDLFEADLPASSPPGAGLLWRTGSGREFQCRDAYSFRDLLSREELQSLARPRSGGAHRRLGAHPEVRDGVEGTRLAVWAPRARGVSVSGDFNGWSRVAHPMELDEPSGIWQLFLPGLVEGELYKFVVRSEAGEFEKIDPFGFRFEEPPRTASVVFEPGKYAWRDQDWISRRARTDLRSSPLAIYEVHAGSWRRRPDGGFLAYAELAEQLVPYVRDLGFTHIELMPLTAHPFSGSWGYQTIGYFAPTGRFGSPRDFCRLVDRCHEEGLGVILDWVPGHFPGDAHALANFDGRPLFEHPDPRRGTQPEWDTLVFDYGRTEVCNFLLSSALFWLEEYHLDGLRVDAVTSMLYLDWGRAEWKPNREGGRENLEAAAFLRDFNEVVHQRFPGVLTVAEESTAWPGVSRPTDLGGLGFTFKWNMGWSSDTQLYMATEPSRRKSEHSRLTFSMMYAFAENFVLAVSHDDVARQGLLDRMPGDEWQKRANLRLLLAHMYGHPGKKHLFMGVELGQAGSWYYDAALDWNLLEWESHRRLQSFLRDLNRVYREQPALHEVDSDCAGFEWIDFHDAERSVISYLRRAGERSDFVVLVSNFTEVPRHDYRVGVPAAGLYRELLNSDAESYGGSNLGNLGAVEAEPVPWQDRPCSLVLTLPPLATLILKPGG